jgi:hypothetical protein
LVFFEYPEIVSTLNRPDSKPPDGELPSVIFCEFSRVWLNRNRTQSIDQIYHHSYAEVYKRHTDVIISKARNSLQRPSAAAETAKSTHQAYTDVGKAVETTHSQNSPGYRDSLRGGFGSCKYPQSQLTVMRIQCVGR